MQLKDIDLNKLTLEELDVVLKIAKKQESQLEEEEAIKIKQKEESVYKEPKTKGLTFLEVVESMKRGKKVRRPIFHKDNYLYLDGDSGIIKCSLTKENAYCHYRHFESTDWEIIEEKKKTLSDKMHYGMGIDKANLYLYNKKM